MFFFAQMRCNADSKCEENQNNDEENRFSTPSQFNWFRYCVFSLWNIRHRAMNITVISFDERKWKIYRMQFILIPNLSIHSRTTLICLGRYSVCVPFIEFFSFSLTLNHTSDTMTTTTTTRCVHNRTNTCINSFRFFSRLFVHLCAAVYPKREQKK